MKILLASTAALLSLSATAVSATTFDFTYTTFSGVIARGQVEATNLGGFYSVDNVTGTRAGAQIDGYDFFDDTPQSFNFSNGRASNVDFSYYVGANNYEVRFPGSGFGTEFTNGNSSNLVTAFSLTPTALVTGAVPEPATWAMIMLGVGVTGASLRRRKVTTRVQFA